MNREEFISKLQLVYVGDKRASKDIILEYDRLNNLNKQLVEECQRLDDEGTRLNKLLDETRLSELHKEYIINKLETELIGIYEGEYALNEEEIKDKLKKIKGE